MVTDPQGESRLAAPAAGFHPGRRFGPFTIVRLLGEGGMGAVYLAQDDLGRTVALKIPKFDKSDVEGRKRFEREAATAGALDHPNICPVYQVGEIGGQPFLAMEYVDGPSLASYCEADNLLNPQQVAFILWRLAQALASAHALGVIHRDLKPENIILRRNAEPVVTDFGLARSIRSDASRVTQSGMIVGSPAYMSPEQIDGDPATVGPATDIYSLGVVLFELLTGRVPFDGAIGQVLVKVMTKPPPRPSELRPGIDPTMEALCLQMLSKDPAARGASMAAIADFLQQRFGQTSSGPTQPAATPPAAPPAASQTVVLGMSTTSIDLITPDVVASAPSPHPARGGKWLPLTATNRIYAACVAAGLVVVLVVACWLALGPGDAARNVASATSSARKNPAADSPKESAEDADDGSTQAGFRGTRPSPVKLGDKQAAAATKSTSERSAVDGAGALESDEVKRLVESAATNANSRPFAGLIRETFDSTDLSGAPRIVETVRDINNERNHVGPGSRRWTGCLTPPEEGVYTLQMQSDDGARVWLDGVQIMSDWKGRMPNPPLECRLELKTKTYWLQVEHFEAGSGTSAWVLSWKPPSQSMATPVPPSAFTLSPELADDCDRLAWFLATTTDAHLRNGPRAVMLATRAVARQGGGDAQRLNTLAAAYAAAGDYSEAVTRQQQAIKLAPTDDRNDFMKRLVLYGRKKAFVSSKAALTSDAVVLPPEPIASSARPVPPEAPQPTRPTRPTPAAPVPAPAPTPAPVQLPAPVQTSPGGGARIASATKKAVLLWEKVDGASGYFLEMEKQIGADAGRWQSEWTQVVTESQFEYRGSDTRQLRWRVTAVDGAGRRGEPSGWRSFKFTR